MKLRDVVGYATEYDGSQYDEDVITAWVTEIEGQVIDEVIGSAQKTGKEGEEEEERILPYVYDRDADVHLLVPDRFGGVYHYYVKAKIDFMNQETERYNNDVALWNAEYNAYAAWHRRNHRQSCRTSFSRF